LVAGRAAVGGGAGGAGRAGRAGAGGAADGTSADYQTAVCGAVAPGQWDPPAAPRCQAAPVKAVCAHVACALKPGGLVWVHPLARVLRGAGAGAVVPGTGIGSGSGSGSGSDSAGSGGGKQARDCQYLKAARKCVCLCWSDG
jgi:hypothetical protein